MSVAGPPSLSGSYAIPWRPISIETLIGAALTKLDSPQFEITDPVREHLNGWYGLPKDTPLRAPNTRGYLTGRECLEIFAHYAQSMTWEQVQRSSSENKFERLQRLPGRLESLYKIAQGPGSKTPWAYLRYRDEYLKLEEAMKGGLVSEAERRFAPQEMLAKIIAYADPTIVQKGMVAPIWHNHETVWYEVAEQVHEKGLHAYFLKPAEDFTKPAQMIFRGAKGTDTTERIIDPNGIGKTVFDTCAPQLVKIWKDYAADHPGSPLFVTGHSLGAVDAQRLLVAIGNDKRAYHDRTFTLFCFASPKLDRATWEEWGSGLPLCSLHFAQHAQDLVPCFGDQNLHMPESTTYYVASSASKLSWQDAHSRPLFPEGRYDPQNRPPEVWTATQNPPDLPSSEIFESTASFVNIKDEAFERLKEWGEWSQAQESIEQASQGSIPTTPSALWSKIWPWSKA